MKKKKYRIKECTGSSGSKYYKIQEKFLLFWVTLGRDAYATYEDAQKTLETIRAFEILDSITRD